MAILRMDNVLIVVDDLKATLALVGEVARYEDAYFPRPSIRPMAVAANWRS